MQIEIPEKLYKIMQDVVKPDEFTPTLESWITTVLEDAVEDYVQHSDHDTQVEWYDYCQEKTEDIMDPLFKEIL